MTRRVEVIVNPAAGQDEPILNVLNRVFGPVDLTWDVRITQAAGDARTFAERAVHDGVDVVAAYGGDGTVGEVASGLVGSGVPMAILPGGTANVLSVELGIPNALADAAALVDREQLITRPLDLGEVNSRIFVLRVGLGLEAEMVAGADRQQKDRLGVFAYALSALQALRSPTLSRYRIQLDDQSIEVDGLTCLIANAGSIGQGTLSISPDINVSDGLLDVVVLQQADIASLFSVATSIVRGGGTPETVRHWQARQIRVTADPRQTIQVDGEILVADSIAAHVIPGAVNVLVP